MKKILSLLIIIGLSSLLSAQDNDLAVLSRLYKGSRHSPYVFSGFLEKSLPIKLVFGVQSDQVKGYIYYGGSQDDAYEIEGSISSEGDLELFEFDPDHRATALIEGNLKNGSDQFIWYTIDRSRQLDLILSPSEVPQKIKLYTAQSDDQKPIIVRSALKQLNTSISTSTNVRWIDYLCDGTDCYESSINSMLYNPLEFIYSDLAGHEELMVYPDFHYKKDLEGRIGISSYHQFDRYESNIYPIIDNERFDNWVAEIFRAKRSHDEHEEHYSIADRLKSRSQGDFFITLWTEELISGYLYKQSTDASKVTTLPFIFDIDRSKFYQVDDLFKKSFDHQSLVKKYVNDENNLVLIEEPQLVKKLLQEEKYKHFALTPDGLLFFTDFNVIYGRRHVVIPYEEIKSSLSNRTVENYIKKKK